MKKIQEEARVALGKVQEEVRKGTYIHNMTVKWRSIR